MTFIKKPLRTPQNETRRKRKSTKPINALTHFELPPLVFVTNTEDFES